MQKFLQHQWLKFRRSPSFAREASVSILTGMLGFLVTLGVVMFAFLLPRWLPALSGGQDPLVFIHKAVIYYFLFEFLMRYLIQKIPVLDVEPYLVLPVPRRKIARFLLLRSVFSLFNAYALILVLPLAVQVLAPEYGMLSALAWVGTVVLFSWSLHFFQLMFKGRYDENPWVWAALLSVAVLNYSADRWLGFDLLQPGYSFLSEVLQTPPLVLVPLIILLTGVILTYRFLQGNLYLEEISSREKEERGMYPDRLEFLNRKGLEEIFILQEIRLILRHKRTRSVLLLSLLFVFYGLLFFGRDEEGSGSAVYILIGIFMSGLFTLNYGQFFWGWNTNQLDFFFSRPVMLKTWVESRYRLLVISAVLGTLLCLPYLYFGWKVMLALFACLWFNIGINIPLMMRMSMWQPKAIDLNRHSFLNYQGTGIAQYVMGIPLLGLPYLVYVPVAWGLGFTAGVVAVGIAGFTGYVFRNYLLDKMVTAHLKRRKYGLIQELTL